MPKHKASSRFGYARAVGGGLVALAFLVGVSLFPHQHAPLPRFIAARGSQAFGLGLWALPFLCLLVGLIVFARRSFALSGRIWGLLGAWVVALMAFHLQYPAGRELLAASGRKGGGYAGAVLTLVLRRVTGEPGLWLATVGGAAAAAMLVWGLSLDDFGKLALTAFFASGRAAARAGRAVAAWCGAALIWLGRAAVWLLLITLTGLRWLGRAAWRAAGAVPPFAGPLAARIAAGTAAAARHAWDRMGVLRRPAAPSGAQPAALAMSAAPTIATEASAATGVAASPPSEYVEDAEGALDAAIPEGALPDEAVQGEMAESEAPSAAEEPAAAGEPAAADGAVALTKVAETATSGTPARSRRLRRRAGVAQEALPFPVEPRRAYVVPDLSLLDAYAAKTKAGKVDPEEVARNLERTLASFGVEAKVVRWETGPVVTRYELQPAPGVKVQKITSLQNDIALSLAASSVRLEAPIPGKSAIGVELPNERPSLVHLREILASDEFQHATTSPLIVGIGKGIAGTPIVADLIAMPHLLIAGATGAGKSVMLNAMIASILFRATPEQARFLMIDPKRVELTNYNGIPHLLSPVVTGAREAAAKLRWAIQEMESRYEMFAKDGVRNIQAFNASHPDRPLAFILIIIDELADLMMVAPADFEEIICRLAQMTRATGIHLLLATQRPSVDVITGLIKANIPSRIAFSVSSQVDSRTILDHPGAEKLLGRGDMLFSPIGAIRPTRVQGAFISDAETERLVQFWRTQGEPTYVNALLQATADEAAEESPGADALLADAARLVVRAGYASVSLLQRKMRIGYVRAARLVDQMEERGIVGPSQGSSPRELLVGLDDLERLLRTAPPAGAGGEEAASEPAGRGRPRAAAIVEDAS